MNAKLFIELCDLLTAKVPELRWIDEDEGQLNTAQGIRPPVDFPCCLIDIHYPGCKDANEEEQIVSATITFKIGFQPGGETNNKAPRPVRERALERLAIVEKVQSVLQGWTAKETVEPLSRKSARPSVLANRTKLYTITYNTEFQEIQE